jgi:hypothetical protein
MTEKKIDYNDQSAAVVLLAVAEMLEAEGKWPRAQALQYAAARLLSFPSWHPSMSVSDGIEIGAWESEHHRAFMRVVDDIMGGGK